MKFLSTRTMSLLAAGALALSLTACGSTATAEQSTEQTETVTVTETAELSAIGAKQSNERLGCVTAVDGDTVTVSLSTGGRGPGGQRPGGDGQTPPSLPSGEAPDSDGGTPPQMSEGQTPPSLPNGEAPDSDGGTPPQMSEGQTPPSLPEGEAPQGDEGAQPQGEDSEAQTVTLSLSKITKDGAAVTAEDLSEGTMLKVKLDDSGIPVSAEVMERGGMDAQRGGMQDRDAVDGRSSATEQIAAEETADV